LKARKVKGLDPHEALADNAERIIRVRLDELYSFMPKAGDPGEEKALHDMRIAAKRLRYILEITHPCFGPYAESAVKKVKDLQDVLGEIHDCDVLLPDVRAFMAELVASDAEALVERAGEAEDLDPKLVREAPNRTAYAGLASLVTHLTARRKLLFTRFLELWQDYERKGVRSRLEFAVRERAGDTIATT
jgi:CHAD domain